jgi:hypothetical protein
MLTPEAGTGPGTYRITVQLVHPRGGPSGVTLNAVGDGAAVVDGNRLAIGTITVPANRE